MSDDDDAGLAALYEGQLDVVLDFQRFDELVRLRYQSPTRLIDTRLDLRHPQADTDDPAEHACHGCTLDPTRHQAEDR